MELYIALFLFLIGTGASTITISSFYTIKNKALDKRYFELTKYSTILAIALLFLGVGTIVWEIFNFSSSYELSNFEDLNCIYKFFILFISNVYMDYLVICLSLLIPISVLYILSFNSNFNIEKKRVLLVKINLLLSLIVAIITASLLRGLTHNIIWDNHLMIFIFFISTLCSGLAIVVFLRSLIYKVHFNAKQINGFSRLNIVLLSFGFWLTLLFTFALSLICISQEITYVLNISHTIGKLWWFGVVFLGFILPLVIYFFSYIKPVHSFFKYMMVSSVLSGAFCLKYTVLLAGNFF